MTVGFSVYPIKQRFNHDLMKKFKGIPTSIISDSMNRIYGNSASLKPYHESGNLIGTAVTVKTRPGDNLMIHKAINMAEPGDVLVVDGDGDMTRALFGEIMMYLCQSKKIAGLIVDGCIRDVDTFQKSSFPVYAKGVTHVGPYKTGPGEVNVPVSIDGLIVNPGDLIVGDADGIVCIQEHEAKHILKKSINKLEYEKERIQLILDGEVNDSYVDDKTLTEMGCKIYE